MPISDPSGYEKGHFERVYMDIFVPACKNAGFKAERADKVSETNVIQLDVLQRLLTAPMALCDLSSRNPNVMFELGLRQAFEMPVVLVQEEDTPPIFDIAVLRYLTYRSTRLYHEVVEDQNKITNTLRSTVNGRGINSLVKLLGLTSPPSPMRLAEAQGDPLLSVVLAELSSLRREIREAIPITGLQTLSLRGEKQQGIEIVRILEMRKVIEQGLYMGHSAQKIVDTLQNYLGIQEEVAVRAYKVITANIPDRLARSGLPPITNIPPYTSPDKSGDAL